MAKILDARGGTFSSNVSRFVTIIVAQRSGTPGNAFEPNGPTDGLPLVTSSFPSIHDRYPVFAQSLMAGHDNRKAGVANI